MIKMFHKYRITVPLRTTELVGFKIYTTGKAVEGEATSLMLKKSYVFQPRSNYSCH
jgi:hypothetical protein